MPSGSQQRVLDELAAGDRDRLALCGGRPLPDEPQPDVLFPGAFNPLHEGHRRMAGIASEFLAEQVAFEISLVNVDKQELPLARALERTRQFPPQVTVWLTRADTFVKKAELFPDSVFVVGADTLLRLASPAYYGDQVSQRDRAIAQLADLGSRFLVFGRLAGRRFCSLEELEVPAALRGLCRGVGETTFRDDISSTALRAGS